MQDSGEKQIEPELFAPPPRKVKRRGTRGCATVFCQLLVLPLAGMALFLLFWGAHMAWVRSSGPVVSATITDRYIDHDSDGKTLRYLAYRYSFEGQSYERRNLVSQAVYERVAPGNSVRVQVSPIWPGSDSLLLVPGVKVWEEVIILLVGAVIVMIGVGAMVWYIFMLPARRKALLIRGAPTMGRITGKNFTASARTTYYYIQYEYSPVTASSPPADASAAEVGALATSQLVGVNDYNSVAEGEFCTVLYDPNRPGISIIYRFADFEVVV